jgi:hypothetical protein
MINAMMGISCFCILAPRRRGIFVLFCFALVDHDEHHSLVYISLGRREAFDVFALGGHHVHLYWVAGFV